MNTYLVTNLFCPFLAIFLFFVTMIDDDDEDEDHHHKMTEKKEFILMLPKLDYILFDYKFNYL